MIEKQDQLKQFDFNDAQARLSALPGSKENNFENNIWEFEAPNGRILRIVFNDQLSESGSNPLTKSIGWAQVNKKIYLSIASSTNSLISSQRCLGLKLILEAMANYGLARLDRHSCTEVIKYLITHSWRNGIAAKNLGIKSHTSFSSQIQIDELKLHLSSLGLDWISRDVTDSFIKKTLKKIIPELTDDELTYQDWLQGGSYNLLTLDYGRYYVEHCLNFFHENYPLAMALNSTFLATPSLAKSCGYEPKTVSFLLPTILQGKSVEDIKRQRPSWSLTTIRKVHKATTNHFKESYQKSLFEAEMLKNEVLEEFVTACEIDPSYENIDRMRVIIWDWLKREDKAEAKRLLSDFNKASWSVFKKQIYSFQNRNNHKPPEVPSEAAYQAIGLVEGDSRNPSLSYPRQLIQLVSKAGLTCMVALTGWRKSEFGFPFSAIKRTRNGDKLDQHAFPWRYQVDWYVYKTSGKVRHLREISFSTYLIAERMQSLICATGEKPCLYLLNKNNNNPYNSGGVINNGIRALWQNFVDNYSEFKKIDDFSAWEVLQESRDAGKLFTELEQQEYNRLLAQRSSKEWKNLPIDIHLKEAWLRAREDWPRLQLFFSSSTSKEKKGWLIRYRNRTLRSDWQALLDTNLPDNIKDWIKTSPLKILKSPITSRKVMNTLLEGTLYPSPHAFRHMWAEAVYRRFDGDAGWMIRSQFKHISRSMWLAYIRDKDNRSVHEKAKAQVISSLVHNYLRHQGEGYAGHLHIWLRRLSKQTSVMSPAEQEKLADRLAIIEIENIKPNPWGYCLLKRRTRNKAKCAELGEPMRFNASPDLCLGCIHNLMQTENVEWALFHVASHVEALKNPVVPEIFKTSSYELVKNVTRHVRTLNPQHEALTELQEVLDHYKALRAG